MVAPAKLQMYVSLCVKMKSCRVAGDWMLRLYFQNTVMTAVNITAGQERLGTLADYLERCMLHMKATAKKGPSVGWPLPPCFLSEL